MSVRIVRGGHLFATLFNLMGMMFLLIMTGFLLRKFDLITDAGKKSITDVLLYAILPCNIIKAFTTDLGTDHWGDFAVLLAIAMFVQVMALFICRFLYNQMDPGREGSLSVCDGLFKFRVLGNPMSEGVFGDTGLLFASVFLLPRELSCGQREFPILRKRPIRERRTGRS